MHYEQFGDGSVKCIEDEIPFEVPEGWAWARIGALSIINPRNKIADDTEISFISMPLISGGYENTHLHEIKKWRSVKNGFTHFYENDIGIAKITPCFENRKSVVFKNLKNRVGAGTTELHILRLLNNTVYPEYLLWNVKTDNFIHGGVQTYTGAVGQQRVGKEYILNYLIAIPPRAVQERILFRITAIFQQLTDIDNNKKNLNISVQRVKNKILDLAIHGKLVPQDPADEPASVLLERIRAEKEELIKQGKIKRDKKESVIFKGDDNSYYEQFADGSVNCIDNVIPFILPSNWRYEKIRNIFVFNPKNNLEDNTTVSFIPMEMIDDQFSGKYRYKVKSWNTCKKGFTHFASNDVAFAKISPCFENRKSVLFEQLENNVGSGTTELYVIRRFTDDILGKYLLYFVKSEYFIKRGKATFSGVVGQQRVDKDIILDTYIPIPPLMTQKNIVKKIESIMSQLENIESNLR